MVKEDSRKRWTFGGEYNPSLSRYRNGRGILVAEGFRPMVDIMGYRKNTNEATIMGEITIKDLIKKHKNNGFIVVSACRGSWTDENNDHQYGMSDELAREAANTEAMQSHEKMDALQILEKWDSLTVIGRYLRASGGDELSQRIKAKLDRDIELNNYYAHELKEKLGASIYSYKVVHGGFVENLGEANERAVYETSFFVPNHEGKGEVPDIKLLFDLGCQITKQYHQDVFGYKAPCENPAYYFKDGQIDTTMQFTEEEYDIYYYVIQYFTSSKRYDKSKRFSYDEPQDNREYIGLYGNPNVFGDEMVLRANSGEICSGSNSVRFVKKVEEVEKPDMKREATLFVEIATEALRTIGIESPQVDEVLREAFMAVIRESNLSKIKHWVETHEIAIISAFGHTENGRDRYLSAALLLLKYGVASLHGCSIENYESASENETHGESFLLVNVRNDPNFYDNVFRLSEYYHQDNFVYKASKRYHALLVGTNKTDFSGYNKRSKIHNFVEKFAPELMREIGDTEFIFGDKDKDDKSNPTVESCIGIRQMRYIYEMGTLRGIVCCGEPILKAAGIDRKAYW